MRDIHISLEEKKRFLEKLGYSYVREIYEALDHIHGSAFIPRITVREWAIRGKEKIEFQEAFSREFKKKLLAL